VAINRATASARHNRAKIKHFQRFGVGIDHPSDRHGDAAKGHHQFWAALWT
jgi:hypothetical protein